MEDEQLQPAHDLALDDVIAQLLAVTGPLTQILEHMARVSATGQSAPDAPPVAEVLTGLLRDVLEPLPAAHGEHVLQSTAAVLDQAAELICSEVFLVPPGEGQN